MNSPLSAELPREFEIPPAAECEHLRALSACAGAVPPRTPRVRRAAALAPATVAAVAAVASASAIGLFDRDVTRADIDARATPTTSAITVCTASGACETTVRETRVETIVRPSDGVTFVAPDGTLLTVTPATGTLQYEPGMLAAMVERSTSAGREHVTVAMPSGERRTLSFVVGDGHVDVVEPGGSVRTLRSGDVVPLVPGTLADEPLTPEKGITFDLADGAAQVWIYPERNEVHVGAAPWRTTQQTRDVTPAVVARYGLKPAQPGQYTVAHTASGGQWVYDTAAGATRTVSWRAGDAAVRVVDRDIHGNTVGADLVAVGRRVDAG